MSDDDRLQLTPYRSTLPVITPTPSFPALASSSGAFVGPRRRIARKDEEFFIADAARIEAQEKQCRAFTSLIGARSDAALAMARLQALPEIAEHAYYKGRAERSAEEQQWLHDVRIAALEHERDEIHAQTEVERAKKRLEDLQPAASEQSTPATAPAALKGLTPAEVQMVAQRLPEMKRETVETLCMMLSGLLAEKNAS